MNDDNTELTGQDLLSSFSQTAALSYNNNYSTHQPLTWWGRQNKQPQLGLAYDSLVSQTLAPQHWIIDVLRHAGVIVQLALCCES